MKDLPSDAPRLDPVPFIVADLLLIGGGVLIGTLADAPLSTAAIVGMTVLIGLGAIGLLYPFVINHARREAEALQERANQIEALARTVSGIAEQISIAASNLPAIAENSARQLKIAEQLPAALKDQLSVLQQQLSATAAEENAALRHELDTLRGAETAKLAAALDGLTRATADLERLETVAAKHSSALDAAIAHLPRVADAFGQQATEALRKETKAAVLALQSAAAEAGVALAAATTEARAGFERGVRDAVAHLASQAASTPPFPAHVVYRPVIAAEVPPPVAAPSEPQTETAAPAPAPEPEIAEPEAAEPAEENTPPPSEPSAAIDDTGLDEPAPATVAEAETPPSNNDAAPETAVIAASEPEPEPEPESQPEPVADEDTSPALPEPVAATAAEPEAPHTPAPEPVPEEATVPSEPDSLPAPAVSETSAEPAAAPQADAPESTSDTAPASDTEPAPDDDAQAPAPPDDTDAEAANEEAGPALSHDGFTRLIATAYIGIGNKLFIRGDGPGLRRDKGVPLQFVSIGKWRWESAELLFPATVKLYKNDKEECVALGELTLEPGHHHEVNATF